MFVIGLGTAAPPRRYAQRECWDAVQRTEPFARLAPRSRAILKKVLCGDNGIATRHLALDSLPEVFQLTPDTLQARFTKHAPALAAEAADRALQDAGCAPSEIDAVLISTCTGYLCPGLTSYVSERLGLRADVFTLDLVGQGCGAALPNLRTAEALLAAKRAQKVLSVCVEICSAAFYLDDDPGVLISACLFGDGAGAAVLTQKPKPGRRRVEWTFGSSCLAPEKRDTLRFGHKGGMLRNMLSLQVPQIASGEAAKLLTQSLAAAGVKRDRVAGWIL
ncbi:MAG: stilbene synthase, partial [Limisphaerales bacterium]